MQHVAASGLGQQPDLVGDAARMVLSLYGLLSTGDKQAWCFSPCCGTYILPVALALSISIPKFLGAPESTMAPQSVLLGSSALQGSFVHICDFSPFPQCLLCLIKHFWCFLSHDVWQQHRHLHFRPAVGLCANVSVSFSLSLSTGGSGCVAAALPMLLDSPSLSLPMATAHCAISALAPLQQYLPSPLLPALDYSFRLPSTLPSSSGPGCWQKGGFSPCPITLPSVADKVSCISPLISSKTFSKCQVWE